MTKYRFNELPDWARDGLYTRSDNLSDYYRIESDTNIPPNDIVYLFVRGTWFNKFDLDLMERSNYDCLLHYYPGQFVEYVQTIAPDIDDDTALGLLDTYQDTFDYVYLEGDYIVMDKGIDEFILGKLEEGDKAVKENCELITYRGSECA